MTVHKGILNTFKTANTGMAVTVDIGKERDIHTENKQNAGKRPVRLGPGDHVWNSSKGIALPASPFRTAEGIFDC